MKLLKWIPLFCSLLLYGQEGNDYIYISNCFGDVDTLIPSTNRDSLWYQNRHNSFSVDDEFLLLGYFPLFKSPQTNFGAPIIGWYWQSNQTTDLRIGDRILDFGTPQKFNFKAYHQKQPHSKIIYSQAYSEGQRIDFTHKRAYRYGSFEFDYDRLVSQGFMLHEKNEHIKFNFQGEFNHPEIPCQSQVRIQTFKNESQWNGGVSDDSLFLSGVQSNWELLPVNWANYESSIKHIGVDWVHSYEFNDCASLSYELNLSQDSLFYEGLQDDSLFYPSRLDSAVSYQRAFSNVKNTLKWSQRFTEDKSSTLGIRQQSFKPNTSSIHKWTAFASLASYKLKNELYIEYGKAELETYTLLANYTQGFYVKGIYNKLNLAYHRTNPGWMQMNASSLNKESHFICVLEQDIPVIDRFAEWYGYINENFNFSASYHSIEGFNYFNEQGVNSISDEDVNVFQAQVMHHLNAGKWHWNGNTAFQNTSSEILPLANLLLNQKVYWQGKLFKEATEMQMGVRALYRSSHPGMRYAPLLGDFYVNSTSQTEGSLRLDVFANFKIQTVKVYVAYEHFNSLWQGEQYMLKPYPMAKPTLRMSLIWNFYD